VLVNVKHPRIHGHTEAEEVAHRVRLRASARARSRGNGRVKLIQGLTVFEKRGEEP